MAIIKYKNQSIAKDLKKKKQAKRSLELIKVETPVKGDVRAIIITNSIFENMEYLSGKPKIQDMFLKGEKIIEI